MRFISWNVNGLRAVHKKDLFLPFVEKERPDILCLQETKASEDQLSEELLAIDGYEAYFSSSEIKKGYSGVAFYTKLETENVYHGMGVKKFDREGRIVGANFGDFILFNVYFPNGGMGPDRLKYKFEFYDAFLKFIEKLRKSGKKIIFCGDVNTAHTEIDLARPKENSNNTGFLPEERAWIDTLVRKGYVDTFRHMHPDARDAYSYWDMQTRARDRNVGWRIDYFFVSQELKSSVKDAEILSRVLGSDHCPVTLELG